MPRQKRTKQEEVDVGKEQDYILDSDVEVDLYNLHEEWVKQPILVKKWSRLEDDAKKALDTAKKNLVLLKAEVSLDIRKMPKEYGFDKVTNDIVDSLLTTDQRIGKAEAEVSEAQYNLNILSTAVKAIDSKGKAIEGVIKLYGMEYFQVTNVPYELTERIMQKE